MEEVLKRLEKINAGVLYFAKDEEYEEFIKDVQSIIKEYRQLQEIEKEHQTTNGELRKQVSQLKEEIERIKNVDIYKLIEDWETGQLIPTSKVIDKIGELKTKRIKFENDNTNRIFIREFTRKYTEKNDHDYEIFNTQEVITYMTNNEYNARISELQELLEKR